MDVSDLSLLFPNEASMKKHIIDGERPHIGQDVVDQLELSYILDLVNSDVTEYFTADPEVISYRQGVFADMLANPDLTRVLLRAMPILNDITALRKMSMDSNGSTESYLYSITEIELYSSCLAHMRDGILPLKENFKSSAFIRLADRIYELTESEYYKDLNQKLTELTSRVREIKSVTIGVNLDGQLRPEHAGVLSINNEYFKSGELIDKILRLDFSKNDYTCIASLIPFKKNQSENQQMALTHAFHSAINDVFRSSIRSWRKIIQTYVLENTDFLIRLIPEIEFIVKGTALLQRLEERGCTLSIPTVHPMEKKIFSAKDIYNPVVACKVEDDIVKNDFTFDENGMIYILTGPNRGGKSVITCAVGLTFLMAQLGLMVPAEHVEMSPADAVFTHFPSGAEDTIDKGRLGEECARLEDIFSGISGNSLVLLDEALSSTGALEASYIAGEILAGFSMAGCRGIFSTHLHELATTVNEINARCANGGVKIDNLVAAIQEGQRNFKILRKNPDGKSYARDIAEKYGLSYDKIMEKIQKG